MTQEAGQHSAIGNAREVLSAWTAPSADEARLRDDYLAFLAEHPATAASRDLRRGHLTASALLLDHDRRRVLLTLHPRAGRWFQLGGHIEPGDDSVRSAARREAIEESGIEDLTIAEQPISLDRHAASCRDSAGAVGPTSHLDVEYVAIAPPNARPRRSAESMDLAWFHLDSLPDGADAVVRGLVHRVRDLGLA